MKDADHDEHLAAICAGDPAAFGRWVALVEPTLRLTLRSFASVVDAEAVLQEALLRVWHIAPRFVPDGKPNGLFRLAVRVARNLAISEWRHRARGVPVAEPEEALAPRITPPDPLLRRRIEECHDALPAKPAAALRARLATDGTEPDETLAHQLSMRVNTFLQNITRARRLLAACLEARGIDLASELT
jgi:DNA-directed RNA polymerase specialized sigma24 family protein